MQWDLGCEIYLLYPLFQVLSACVFPQSLHQIKQKQRIVTLKHITKPIKLMTLQKNKYKEWLSLHNNFHWEYEIV